MEMFSVYRYGTVSCWWKKRFGKGVVSGIKAAAALLMSALIWDMVKWNVSLLSVEVVAKIGVLWMFHSVSMAALFTLSDLFSLRRFTPGALLLLEGVTFMIGCRVRAVSHAMYGMWGMYLQSGLCETGGFSAGMIIAAEVILLAASFCIGQEYLKKQISLE